MFFRPAREQAQRLGSIILGQAAIPKVNLPSDADFPGVIFIVFIISFFPALPDKFCPRTASPMVSRLHTGVDQRHQNEAHHRAGGFEKFAWGPIFHDGRGVFVRIRVCGRCGGRHRVLGKNSHNSEMCIF